MPTSVLLAVLAAAGLLALAPALVRRYDVGERLAAERATSTARVLTRRRRRRTVPGRHPVKPPSYVRISRQDFTVPARSVPRRAVPLQRRRSQPAQSAQSARSAQSAQPVRSARPSRTGRTAAASVRRPVPTALHRRRRVLVALLGLNLVELAGVLLVGPGFWIGFSVSFTVLLADLVYLRRRAMITSRRRRRLAHRAAWVAAQQAAVRREHQRRAAQRQAAARQAIMDREAARRSAMARAEEYVERYAPRAATGTDSHRHTLLGLDE